MIQIPPKESIHEHRTNRSFGSDIMVSSQHPLVSSRIPINRTCTQSGSNHRNQALQKVMMIRNKVTQQQTSSIALAADKIGDTSCFLITDGELVDSSWNFGVITAVSAALRIWISQRNHTVRLFLKKAEIIPNRKDGPALLQKDRRRSASLLLIRFSWYKSLMHF